MTEHVLWVSVRSDQDILSGSAPFLPKYGHFRRWQRARRQTRGFKSGWHHAGFTLHWFAFFLSVVVKKPAGVSSMCEFQQIVLAASDPEVITMISFGRWNCVHHETKCFPNGTNFWWSLIKWLKEADNLFHNIQLSRTQDLMSAWPVYKNPWKQNTVSL